MSLSDNNEVLELNFVPEWARRPADSNPYARFERAARDRRGAVERSGRGAPQKQGGSRPTTATGDRRAFKSQRPAEKRAPARPVAAPEMRAAPSARDLPVEISFLPDRRGLKPIALRLARSGRAFPLFEVAALFLSKPEYFLVKHELVAAGAENPALRLFQCSVCKAVFLERAAAANHAFNRHFERFYTREQKQGEPPQGNFLCVARCGLSGVLLGPPNHHEFTERLLELHRTQFPEMPLADYRRNLRNETDPALIEQWKKEVCSQTVFSVKNTEPPQTFKRLPQAQAHFMENYAADMIVAGRRFVAPGTVCLEIEDAELQRMIREAWSRENRFPLKMALAIQPAFRHFGLRMFKTAGKATFVTSIAPRPIDAVQTTENVRGILEYLCGHPGINRQELVASLYPELPPETPPVAEAICALRWLIERGHVIEFFNGTLSLPIGAKGNRPSKPDVHPPKHGEKHAGEKRETLSTQSGSVPPCA